MASMLGVGFTGNVHEKTIGRRAQERRSGADRSPLALAGLIEGEIIPRMLVVHRDELSMAARAKPEAAEITAAQADTFADLVLRSEAYSLIQHVEAYLRQGVTMETVLIDLLAPAARKLGDYWEEDVCDFVDVTMGLWRLQEVVHEIAARLPTVATEGAGDRRALFGVAPGEQHGFGVTMVEEFFRRAGWSTWNVSSGAEAELIETVRRQRFDVVGLSISCDSRLDRFRDVIAAIRNASRNPDLCILVGGRLLTERPELAHICGADATAPDARQAVVRAEMLLEMLTCRVTSPC